MHTLLGLKDCLIVSLSLIEGLAGCSGSFSTLYMVLLKIQGFKDYDLLYLSLQYH